MKTQAIKILGCQITIPTLFTAAERNDHLQSTAQRIHAKLIHNHHDMVVLPELSSMDYSSRSFDHLHELAEPLDGRSHEIYSRLAKQCGVFIVYGIARKSGNDFYISQVVIDSNGEHVGHFDKLHLANFGYSSEKAYFKAGNQLFVFELNGIKVAPIICYDIRIPELSRTLALDHEVQLILHCGAYGRDQSFYTWHDFVITRALENQLYILSLNRAGEQFGHSFFCPPWIDETMPGFKFPDIEESMCSLSVEANTIDEIRSRYSFLSDRRDNYNFLTLR